MSGNKPQYTFNKLITTVEYLKTKIEGLQKDNELYREHTKRLEERLESVESHCNIHGLGLVKKVKPGEGIISIKTPEKINGFITRQYDAYGYQKNENNKLSAIGEKGIRVRPEFSQNINEPEENLEEEALAELMGVENDLLKIENDETQEFSDSTSHMQPLLSTKLEQNELEDVKANQINSESQALFARIESEVSAKIQKLEPNPKLEPVKLEPEEELESYECQKPTSIKTSKRHSYEKEEDLKGTESKTRSMRSRTQAKDLVNRPKRQSTETNPVDESSKLRRISETIKNYNEIQNAKAQGMKSKTRNNKPPSKFDKFEMDEDQVDEAIEEQSKNVIEVKKKSSPTKKVKVYCKCKSKYTNDSPMIGCDGPCQDWYHFDCVGIPQNFRSIAEWYCEDCFFKITNGSIEVCLCGGWFEPAHELVRCKSVCKKLYHPGCLGLDNEQMVERWEVEREGKCGYCKS